MRRFSKLFVKCWYRWAKKKRAEVLTALLTSLGDSDEEASARIREVLDGIGQLDVSDLHLLRRLLKVSTPSERARLLHALEKLHLKPPILVPLLTDALEFPDRAIRLWAVKGLGKIGASARGRGFAGLLAVLKDRDEDIVRATIEALPQIGDPGAGNVPTLTDVVKDDKSSTIAQRLRGWRCLAGNDNRKQALDPLMTATRSNSAELCRTAIATLRYLGPPSVDELATSILAKSLESPSDPVELRLYAAWVVDQGNRNAIDCGPALLVALHDSDRELRLAAAAAILRVKPRTRETAEALTKSLDRDDQELRLRVRQGPGSDAHRRRCLRRAAQNASGRGPRRDRRCR